MGNMAQYINPFMKDSHKELKSITAEISNTTYNNAQGCDLVIDIWLYGC